MSCWVCGKETPAGKIECDVHSNVNVTQTDCRFKMVDWNKVTTLDEMKVILTVMGLRVVVGSAAWERLRDFLED